MEMEDRSTDQAKLEEMLLARCDELGENAYEMYISGELSLEQLEDVYKMLSAWTRSLLQSEIGTFKEKTRRNRIFTT